MKYVIAIYSMLLIAACATVNPQIETIKECKSLCRGNAIKYIDETVTCECQLKENK